MIYRMVAVLAFFGLLMTAASYIVQPARAQTPSTGAGSTGQSGPIVGAVDPHLFCNTGVMTPICK
jgi:hypothetical protein